MIKWLMRLGFGAVAVVVLNSPQLKDILVNQFAGSGDLLKVAQQQLVSGAQASEDASQWISGKVVSVSDGDTITVDTGNDKQRIRLLAIDAPEVSCHGQVQRCKESGQRFGLQSKEWLARTILNETVKVRLNGQKTYDRKVGTIFYKNVDVNYALVHEGMAWHYTKFAAQQPGDEASTYADAQMAAQAKKKGLWADPNPEAPWAWRKGH